MFQVSHSRASLFLNQLLAVPRRSYLTLLASPAAPSTSFWVWGNLTEPGAETGRRLGARAGLSRAGPSYPGISESWSLTLRGLRTHLLSKGVDRGSG